VDIKKIKQLIELVHSTDINEIEIQDDELSVRINRAQPPVQSLQPVVKQTTHDVAPLATNEPKPQAHDNTNTGHPVTSPMVGTMYTARSPNSPPFTDVGKTVNAGDTLCLIEAMKMFNEIEADRAGTVKACLVEDGQPVEFGQTLFIIE